MKTHYIFPQKLKTLLFALVCLASNGVFAQTTGFTLSWDSEVGCLEYNDKRPPSEDIGDNDCLLVCQESTVNFHLDYGTENVIGLEWTTDGGHIDNVTNNDTDAAISWPNAYDHGSVTVHITLANGNELERSVCVTVKPKPEGGFEILGDQSQPFCLDSEVLFQNNAYVSDGSQIVSYNWVFESNSTIFTTNVQNPSHTFDQPGDYTITLTVYDECGCSMTWSKKITITEKPGWEISCPTVVCEGALETYTLNSLDNSPINCSNYKWIVEGGHITQQGNDWVNVVWDNVDEDGFGYVYFDEGPCEVACGNLLVAKVPVIASHGTIKGGKTELCLNEQSRYALPRWPTTDVQWRVFGANNPGSPIPGATFLVDQRNEIAVDATVLPSGNYVLRADYRNTLLQCGGNAEFPFFVLQALTIHEPQTSAEICENDTQYFDLNQGGLSDVTWSFSKNGQTVATVPGTGTFSHVTYQFPEPGHYTVKASTDGYCTDFVEVDVVEIPDIGQASISGSDEICPDLGEDYTFDGETNGFEVHWTVDHGSFLGPDVGETVTIKFDDPNYSNYVVSAQLVSPTYNNCSSDMITYEVHKLEPNAQILQTTGNANVICTSSEESFELTGYDVPDYYEWSIQPEELAHVSGGQGDKNVDILFNEPYQGQTQGTITVRAKVCGVLTEVANYNFEINPHPILTIVEAPNEVCPNDPFSIKVSSVPPVPVSTVGISFSGITLPNAPYISQIGQGTYEIQNIILPNADPNNPVNINYTIGASSSEFCGAGQVSGTLDRNPAPVIQVSHTVPDVFCDEEDISTILTANIQGAGIQPNDIEWIHAGINVGSGPTLDLGNISNGGFGYYYAQATNTFGCVTVSEPFDLNKVCGPDQPAPPCQNESVMLSASWTDCEQITLTANYSGNPNTLGFYKNVGFTAKHADGLPPTDSNNTYTQKFDTDASGTYIFIFIADYGDCKVTEHVEVNVDYAILMDKKIKCDPQGYKVTILNQSTTLPGSNPNVDYEFKKIPSGQIIPPDSENDLEATATLGNGDYELTLTLSNDQGDPTCEVTQTIHLQKPVADFSIANNPTCAEDPVFLHPDNPTPDATYKWEFQGATNTLENINPTLNGPDNAEIILTVTDAYGCSDSSMKTIVVNKADFTIKLKASPSDEICEGASTDLSYQIVSGSSPDDYQWYKDQQPIAGATNATLPGVNEPGEYALHLFDAYGCEDATASSIFINRVRPPHLSAEITGSVCDGDDIELTGTLTPGSAEYKISRKKDNDPYVVVQAWTTGPDIDYTDNAPSVGGYSYKVEYKDPQTTCSATEIFHGTVHPTPTVTVQMDPNIQCSPYRIHLTATGNQPGTYTWSNGMDGASITVDHGGPYKVWFRPDGADCEATTTFDAPKSPDVYTWIFPTGCFDYCSTRKKNKSIIGPIPYFDGGYAYGLNGTPIAPPVPGVVPPLELTNQQGALNLYLDNGFCDVRTDDLDLSTSEACKRDCDLDFKLEDVHLVQQDPFVVFELYGGIQNPYNFDISVDFQSADGVFSPGSAFIPANGFYDFAAHNLVYVPYNPANTTVILQYTVTIHDGGKDEIVCNDSFQFHTPPVPAPKEEYGHAEMNVVPNPVQTITDVNYTVQSVSKFHGGSMELYSLAGNLIKTRKVTEAKGCQTFELSGLASGNYVLVFYHQNARIGQQIIVKQ